MAMRHGLAIQVDPREWLSAWNPVTSRLGLRLPAAPEPDESIAVRVALAGPSVSAMVTGTAVSAEAGDPECRVELSPDHDGLRAVLFLCAAARGEPVRFRNRPLRYRVRLPVVVFWSGGRLPTSAISISEGGCALRWAGQPPAAGQPLNLSVPLGGRSYGLRGVVCWSERAGPGSRAGLRLLSLEGGRAPWRELLAEAARSGAVAG
jgi:PilZ domain